MDTSTGASGRPRRSWVSALALERNVVIMSSSLLILLSASFTWQRLIPLILRDYGGTDFGVSLALSIISFSHAIFQVLGGIVADRWGRKIAIVVPGVVAVVFYILMSQTRSWLVLACLILCNRICGAIQAPSFAAILAESVSREKRGMAFAVFQVATGLGYTIGPVIGAFLLSSLAIDRLMLLNAAALAIATAMRWFGLSETVWGGGQRPAGAERLTWTGVKFSAARVWRAVTAPGGRLILAAGTLFVLVMTMTVQGPFIPFWAQDQLGYSKSQVNLLFSAGPLVAITISLLGGRLIGIWGPRAVLVAGLLGFGPLLAVWLGTPGFASGLWVFTAAYVFLQVSIIAYDTLRTELVEGEGRGLALGILGALTGTMAAAGPPLASWLQGRLGRLTPFVMTFIAIAVLAAVLVRDAVGARRARRAL